MIKSVNILFILLLVIVFNCGKSNELKIITNDRGERVALGEVTSEQLSENFSKYKQNYQDYEPDTLALNNLDIPSGDVEIITILGTWCSDSQREIPRFIKVMEKLKNKNIQVKYICVDRSKKDGAGLVDPYEVELIPTFIIKYNNEEIGRIIEIPQISIEEDLLEIFNSVAF